MILKLLTFSIYNTAMVRKNTINRRAIVLLLVLVMILSTSACAVITPEEPPVTEVTPVIENEPTATIDWFPATPTPTQLPTSQPQPSPIAFNPSTSLGELFLADDFSQPGMWPTSKTSVGNVVYGENSLSLAVAGNKGSLTSMSSYSLPEDFYLEINASVSLCQYGDQYGVLFWQRSSGDFYRLVLTCDGRLRLELVSEGSGTVLKDWTYASRMMPDAPTEHLIGLWAWNGEIRVFINGAQQFMVKTVPDRSGTLGVYARAAGDTAMTVGFSELKIYKVNQAP